MEPNELGGELMKYFSRANIQARVWHLQTESFAEHKALDEFYTAIGDFQDALLEEYQGYYKTRISGEMNFTVDTVWAEGKSLKFLEGFSNYLHEVYKHTYLQPGCLKNLMDEINGLVSKTLYLLTLK